VTYLFFPIGIETKKEKNKQNVGVVERKKNHFICFMKPHKEQSIFGKKQEPSLFFAFCSFSLKTARNGRLPLAGLVSIFTFFSFLFCVLSPFASCCLFFNSFTRESQIRKRENGVWKGKFRKSKEYRTVAYLAFVYFSRLVCCGPTTGHVLLGFGFNDEHSSAIKEEKKVF